LQASGLRAARLCRAAWSSETRPYLDRTNLVPHVVGLGFNWHQLLLSALRDSRMLSKPNICLTTNDRTWSSSQLVVLLVYFATCGVIWPSAENKSHLQPSAASGGQNSPDTCAANPHQLCPDYFARRSPLARVRRSGYRSRRTPWSLVSQVGQASLVRCRRRILFSAVSGLAGKVSGQVCSLPYTDMSSVKAVV